jgi:hypothetical protein
MSTDILKNDLKRAMIGAHVKLSDDMLSKCEYFPLTGFRLMYVFLYVNTDELCHMYS